MLIKWLNIKRITGAGWLKSYYDAGRYTYILHSPRPCNTWVVRVFTACRWCTWSEKSAPFLIHINSVSIIMSAFWNKTFNSLLMTAGFTIDEKQFVFLRKKTPCGWSIISLVKTFKNPWGVFWQNTPLMVHTVICISYQYCISFAQFSRVTSLFLNLLKIFWFLISVGIFSHYYTYFTHTYISIGKRFYGRNRYLACIETEKFGWEIDQVQRSGVPLYWLLVSLASHNRFKSFLNSAIA